MKYTIIYNIKICNYLRICSSTSYYAEMAEISNPDFSTTLQYTNIQGNNRMKWFIS